MAPKVKKEVLVSPKAQAKATALRAKNTKLKGVQGHTQKKTRRKAKKAMLKCVHSHTHKRPPGPTPSDHTS